MDPKILGWLRQSDCMEKKTPDKKVCKFEMEGTLEECLLHKHSPSQYPGGQNKPPKANMKLLLIQEPNLVFLCPPSTDASMGSYTSSQQNFALAYYSEYYRGINITAPRSHAIQKKFLLNLCSILLYWHRFR